MSNWVYTVENQIYTTVAYRAKKELIADYPTIFFTMDAEPENTDSHFPTVFIHFLPNPEIGETLDGQDINAITSTVQIEVTTSKEQKQKGARLIAWEVVEQFKKLRYSVVLAPEVKNTGNDTNYCVARVRRVIGNADSLS